MIPFTITGFIMGNFGIIRKLQNNKVKTFVLSLIIFIFIDKYEIFYNLNGVAYPGIKINNKHFTCQIMNSEEKGDALTCCFQSNDNDLIIVQSFDINNNNLKEIEEYYYSLNFFDFYICNVSY